MLLGGCTQDFEWIRVGVSLVGTRSKVVDLGNHKGCPYTHQPVIRSLC